MMRAAERAVAGPFAGGFRLIWMPCLHNVEPHVSRLRSFLSPSSSLFVTIDYSTWMMSQYGTLHM